MRRIIFRLIILSLILVLSLFMSSCNIFRYSNLDETIAELQEENAALKEQVEELTSVIESGGSGSGTGDSVKKVSFKNLSNLFLSGFCHGVYVDGDYAYTGGENFKIIDISDKENPALLSSSNEVQWAPDFKVQDDFAYITYTIFEENSVSESGFKILNLSDKNNPGLPGTYKIEGQVIGISVEGEYAYLPYQVYNRENGQYIFERSGLEIVDISDPSSPVLYKEYDYTD
ncbi:MAG: hypothetical protein JW770_06275, partial [Actinobacteria bacterium]|nr:hypothetical protein [Actinomycetota bacterium]